MKNTIYDGLFYSRTHEWVKVDGIIAWVGITDYAQGSLGTICYVETMEVGDCVEQFKECGAVESVKAASDILAPISGIIIEVNEEVLDKPELINQDAYENWLFKVEIRDESELSNLLSSLDYKKVIND